MKSKRVEFLGFPLDAGVDVEKVCGLLARKTKPQLVSFINPGAWALSARRPEYLGLLNEMTMVLADGEGVARAARWLAGEDCQRLSFDMSSLAGPFFEAVQKAKATIMFIGGKPGVDEEFISKLHGNMPELKIIGSQHGFGEIPDKVVAVMKKNPDVVIVGMGSPRQEAFLVTLRDAGYEGVAMTCGGFLDQYLLSDPYYPKWIDKYNLRWLYRLYMEPSRLWRRYLIDYPVFVKLVFMTYAQRSKTALKRS